MKIISILGARPQFIKAAIISKKIKEKGIEEIIVHTGQHYDYNMSDIFFKELGIPEPAYHLKIGSASHGDQTGRMLMEIEKVLVKEKPDAVMVYGDTNSTLAGSLAASKLHIPVAHVEAGLRSFNKKMPEEINRILTDHVSSILFSPTDTGLANLKNEGFPHIFYSMEEFTRIKSEKLLPACIKVGDPMFDLALEARQKTDASHIMRRWNLEKKQFILVTTHRAENTDVAKNLENIWNALKILASEGKKIIFPVHPRTRKVMEQNGLLNESTDSQLPLLIDPISYSEMTVLESEARVIITDSGGVQKEGYFFDTPCVVTREQTEWVELLESGWTSLTGAEMNKILIAARQYWETPPHKGNSSLFGNGNASDQIVEILKMTIL